MTDERTVLFVGSDRLGEGPEELGRVLIRSFFKTLAAMERRPWRVIFVNSGIALSIEGSPVLEELAALEAAGTEILSCGTCLDYFQSKDRLRAGRVSNMHEIVETLLAAGRILRP